MTNPGVECLGRAGWPAECGEEGFRTQPQPGWGGFRSEGLSQRWSAEGTLQPVLVESGPSTAPALEGWVLNLGWL